MKISISEERRNKVMERKEFSATIDHEGMATPRKEAVRESLAAQLGASKDNVEVMSIFTDKGRNISKARVRVWDKKVVQPKQKGAPAEGKPEEKK